MSSYRKTQQQGFTLIELIMVIVILGVLSAFALPKFADLSSDSEKAAIEGARAAVASALGISHAACLAGAGSCVTSAATDTVDLEGTAYNMVFGYPAVDHAATPSTHAANSSDICAIAGLDGFTCTSKQADNTDSGTNGDAAKMIVTRTGTSSSCSFTYTEATSATVAASLTAATCP